jgi:nucleotide-binding universal stress UspA family protein
MPTVTTPTRIKLQNVLFATDFSVGDTTTFSHAVDLSRRYGAMLYMVHVLPHMPFVEAPVPDPAQIKAAVAEQFKNLINSVALQGVAHKELIEEGEVPQVLSKVVREYAIDLIVLGTGGRHGLGKVLLGSTAEEVFRTADCPVLTIGPHAARWDVDGHLQHVLFATDFGAESLHALPYAISLAEENHARLTLLHVSQEPGVILLETGPGTMPVFEKKDEAKRVEEHLRSLIPEGTQLWHEPEYMVEFGHPADAILAAARNSVDMIVLGAKRSAALSKHFGEGVTYRIACEAPCPVLSVGPGLHER